jgi:hypothetical protein
VSEKENEREYDGEVEATSGGFIVKHPDGTTSSYTTHGDEEVPKGTPKAKPARPAPEPSER